MKSILRVVAIFMLFVGSLFAQQKASDTQTKASLQQSANSAKKKTKAKAKTKLLLTTDTIPPINSQPTNTQKVLADSAHLRDTVEKKLLVAAVDSASKLVRQSIDTIIVYQAKDSAIFTLSSKKMRLRGDANITMKNQKLSAEIIEMSFDETILSAQGVRDSAGKGSGFPKFVDGKEEFAGERLSFNLKTKQGIISLGETNVENGFYYGSKVKRMDERTFFVENGAYTTCDKPHPHFYFGSPEMKVITNDRIFFDPLIMYVEDLPVFILPIGLYFENRGGRQSGLMVPSFFFSSNNGVVFQNMGYYFALSDYYDTQFGVDIFTKSGYLLKNSTRYVQRDVLNGNFQISFGKRRTTPDDPMLDSWNASLMHSQKFTPQTSATANLSFSSQDFNRNFSTDITKRLQQQIYSNASISTSFDNGSTLSAAFSRTQNLITNESQMSPSLTYSVPQIFPLKKYVPSDSWLRDIGMNYSVSGNYSLNRVRVLTLRDTVSNIVDTSFRSDERYFTISHSPSISISPKFGNFSVTPSISYRENWYFRKLSRSRLADSLIENTMEYSVAPLREYRYDMGVNIGTRLFGLVKPRIFGINALRHTFQPSFGYRYTPEFSSRTTSYIGSYYDSIYRRSIDYSHFESDGGFSSSKASQQLTYSFANSFEAKIAQGDTSEDKKIDLLRFNIAGNYDFEKDSLRFSDISTDFRTPALDFLNFNGRASFSLYDSAPIFDSLSGQVVQRQINSFLASSGKGLARLTNFSMNISTHFGSDGSAQEKSSGISDSTANKRPNVGERFAARVNYTESECDLYGDNSPGWTPFSMPWQINLAAAFTYFSPVGSAITRRFDISGDFGIVPTTTWRIGGRFNFDVIGQNLFVQSINITKDLHCWDLTFDWTPSGFNQGFYLRFGIKASQLRDLKLEKRANPLYR